METLFSGLLETLIRRKAHLLIAILTLSLSLWSCGKGRNSGNNASSDSPADTALYSSEDNVYHADNDIAMTLKSIADAIHQGEQLDSISYNYEGILTDGTGRPIYTDIQGAPGLWSINVDSPESVSIRNLYLGDLLPEALENYITQSLGLDETNIVDASGFKKPDSENVLAYNFDGGYLVFETRTALTPAGQEGPLMTITATSNVPESLN